MNKMNCDGQVTCQVNGDGAPPPPHSGGEFFAPSRMPHLKTVVGDDSGDGDSPRPPPPSTHHFIHTLIHNLTIAREHWGLGLTSAKSYYLRCVPIDTTFPTLGWLTHQKDWGKPDTLNIPFRKFFLYVLTLRKYLQFFLSGIQFSEREKFSLRTCKKNSYSCRKNSYSFLTISPT